MEIERKFHTKTLPFPITAYPCRRITQAYLATSPTIRIRKIAEEGGVSYVLTVKGKGHLAREEFELPISEAEYTALLPKIEGTPVVKKRYLVPLAAGLTAEVDIYEGALAGLMTTEVEFSTLAAAEAFVPPDWFGADVSEERAYKNTSLALYGLPQA